MTAVVAKQGLPPELVYAVGALNFAQKGYDFGDLVFADAVYRWHVAKAPMMRFDTEFGGALESDVGMVPRAIINMDEWWPFVSAASICAMTFGTIGLKQRATLFSCSTQTWNFD